MIVKCENPVKVASRMFFLAYEASQVFGLGILQAKDGITEEKVWKIVTGNATADYIMPVGKEERPYADYVFGRMMKLGCVITNDSIEIRDTQPTPDYQSWCRTYPTYLALLNTALMQVSE